jgi:GAF domain-containing protein
MRAEGDLPELLAAIARTISESLGYRTVVVNLYRPAWDNFSVTTVHGNDAARSILLGQVRTWEEWAPLLESTFERRGAFVVPAGAYDWESQLGDRSYVPDTRPGRGEHGWNPEDALFLPMRHSNGHLLGIPSVDEPMSGRRPTDEELDVLVALAEHAALAVQSAQEGK